MFLVNLKLNLNAVMATETVSSNVINATALL